MNRTALERIQRTYWLVTALGWFATVLPAAVSVLYAQSRGFSLLEIGMFMGVYSVTVALLEVPTGGLADAVGRKRVAIAAYALSLAATGLFLVAFSLPVLLAYACLYGAARALGSGALQAWFVDALQEADPAVDLQPQLALAGTFELLALAAATLVGSLLPTVFADLPTGPGVLLTPLAVPLLAAMLMKGVTIVAIALLVREARPDAAAARATDAAGETWSAVLRDAVTLARTRRAIPLLLAVEALSGFSLMALETFWQPFFAGRLGGAEERTWIFGLILAGSFGVGMLGNLAAIPASRWLGGRHARVAIAFRIVHVGALALLAQQQGVAAAAGLFWLTYFAMGGANSPLATLFNLEVPARRRSVMLSVLSLAGYAGSFAGSIALAAVAHAASIGVAWTVAAGVLAASMLLLLRLDRTCSAHGRGAPAEPAP